MKILGIHTDQANDAAKQISRHGITFLILQHTLTHSEEASTYFLRY